MPTPAEQLPGGVTGMAERLAALEREVAELRAARRLEAASIGSGGLKITDGGRFSMDTPSGTRMVDIGVITNPAYNHTDGSQQQAQLFRREDGTPFLECFASPGDPDHQFWSLWDSSSHIVAGDDATSGEGLARPYLPLQLWPAYAGGWAASWPSVNTTAMQSLFTGRFYKQQPRLVVLAQASMDTAGATGSLQLKINGVYQDVPQSVDFGVSTYTFGPFPLADFGGHMSQIEVSIDGRRDTGTGAIRATVYSSYTLQS